MEPWTIQPIILHRGRDAGLAESTLASLSHCVEAVGEWYRGQMGRPFRALARPADLEVVSEELYRENALECLAQTIERHGWPNRAPAGSREHMPYIYLAVMIGQGGFAGAVHWPGQVGLAGLGDACLEALAGNEDGCLQIIGGSRRRCGVDGQRGALAHELMHALGWGEHTETPARDLSSWEYEFFPDCVLPEAVRSHLRSRPWSGYFAD